MSFSSIPSALSPDRAAEEGSEHETHNVAIALTHRNTAYTFHLPVSSTVHDLTAHISAHLSVPADYQKLLAPKLGLLRNPELPLTALAGRKLTLLGSSRGEVESVTSASVTAAASASARRRGGGGGILNPARPAPRHVADPARVRAESTYTFFTLRPLPQLPTPHLSLAFLNRLKSDPGIVSVMIKYRWTVPLLAEMDPASHTTHSSKTLGLNRNKGEVIELRLMTDDYDGYRDYGTVRRTLVHELCHNVFGEHDRNFWDMYKRLEREVREADWKGGKGEKVGGRDVEFYEPPEHETGLGEEVDGGGWTGGEFVLGGGNNSGGGGGGNGAGERPNIGLTRREILAKAAEERIKRQMGVPGGTPSSSSPSSSSSSASASGRKGTGSQSGSSTPNSQP